MKYCTLCINNMAPKGTLGDCPTNDSCNKCIHFCCLPCSYVTKPFGVMQRVIKSQKVCISFTHCQS